MSGTRTAESGDTAVLSSSMMTAPGEGEVWRPKSRRRCCCFTCVAGGVSNVAAGSAGGGVDVLDVGVRRSINTTGERGRAS